MQRIATLRSVQGQRALDDLGLMADTFGIQTGARTGQVRHRAIEQGTGQRTGSGGVADAHFATDEQLRTRRFRPQHAVATGLQGEFALRLESSPRP